MLVLLVFAFISGIITVLSPCILPLLPIVLSGSVGGGKARPFGIITGFIVSFTFFTLALTAIVGAFKISPDVLRIVASVVLILFGIVMVVPWLKDRFQMLFSSVANLGSKASAPAPQPGEAEKKAGRWAGFTSGIFIGLSLGLVWTPCVGPIMASVITLALTQKVDNGAVFITLAYSAGTSIPMLAIMLGGRALLQKVPGLLKNSEKIQKVFGVLMIVVGITVWSGLDRQFQTVILKIFPNYGSGLTAIENNKIVKNELKNLTSSSNTNRTIGKNPSVFNGVSDFEGPDESLPDYGLAPDFVPGAVWINTQPMTLASLRGKVVMVDFWTYSCINCIRTIPYLQSWYNAYKDKGLVIVGIHTPEFEFEKNTANVQKAAKQLGVTWPVVQDNDYKMWNLYKNQYWPAHYFIDKNGHVRYFHFGEGSYMETEKVIQRLIAETGVKVQGTVTKIGPEIDAYTPETYLGYERASGFAGSPSIAQDRLTEYKFGRELFNGEWSISGKWTVSAQFIVPDGSGSLDFAFNAKNVFLVITPVEPNAVVQVKVDGSVSRDTADVSNGSLTVRESRLYQLVGLKSAGSHRLHLEIKGKVRLFAFTFG